MPDPGRGGPVGTPPGRRLAELSARNPRGLRAGALALFAAACVPMLVMLPAALAGVLATVGVRAEAGWVQALSTVLGPVAQPLLVASTLLLAAGALVCGRLPVAAALAGGTLLYLGMYVVTGPAGRSQPALFYSGLALFLASPALTLWRPRAGVCRPLLSRRQARAALLGVGAVSALLLVAGPALRGMADIHGAHVQALDAGTRETPSTGKAASEEPSGQPVVRVERDKFLWSARVNSYSDQGAWFPEISTDGARLEIQGSVKEGAVYVQLMDGAAVIVYEETFTRLPEAGIAVELPGVRGVWMVNLAFQDFGGGLEVTLGPA